MAYDVFISYSTPDKVIADAACATLEQRQIRCWMAPRDVLPGAVWGAAIVDAIHACRILVLVLSETSNTSPQVSREVERAASRGLPIVPFRVSNVELSKEMEYFVSDRHWLDAVTPPLEQHLQKLALTVRALLDVADRDLPVRPTATERAGAPELPTYRLQRSMRPWAQRGLVPAAIIVAALVVVGTGGLFLWRTTQAPPSAAVLELNGGPAAVNSSPAAPVAVAVSSPSQGLAGATSTPATQPASNPAPSPIATQRFGPLTQSLTHGNDSSLTTLDAHVNVSNFVAEATFMNPYERAQKGWDYGFVFRSTGSNQQYRIWVDSDRNWYLRLLTGPESSTDVKHGMLNNLNVSVTGSNKLEVVVADSAAYLFVNDTYIDTLDVSVRKDSGSVLLAINFGTDHHIPGRVTRFENFDVRPYALKYGPQSRSIQHSSDPQEVNFAYIRPPVQVQDFVFEATFDNPYAGAEHGWDDGFFFRSTGAYQNYWIWFDSNGAWSCILLQTGSDPIELNTGSVAKLNTGAGQSNTMRVIALGSVGYFFVNDVFVDRLDLSRKVAAGDAGAGIGMADDDKIAGRVTSVANYLVASLD